MKATKHTEKIITPLRFALSLSALRGINTDSPEAFSETIRTHTKARNITFFNTKRTRPVFVDRENPDTPPAITTSTRELARLMKNSNDITTHETRDFLRLDARINQPYTIKPTYRPLWVFNDWTRKRYTVANNVNSADKPAFRHDSLYLFDILSEDYDA